MKTLTDLLSEAHISAFDMSKAHRALWDIWNRRRELSPAELDEWASAWWSYCYEYEGRNGLMPDLPGPIDFRVELKSE